MKKLILLSIILFMVYICRGYTFQNEPNTFRGIKWGSSLANIKNMFQIEPPDNIGISCYKRKGDKLKIGEALLKSIKYYAFKDKFYFVDIEFNGINNFLILKKIFFQLYGLPQYNNDNFLAKSYIWKGVKVKISLIYFKTTEVGSLTYEYLPILEEKYNEIDRLSKKRQQERINKLRKKLGDEL